MNNHYPSAVKLLKTKKYNTYQLAAQMADPNTSPEDGLKIAALTCLAWLRKRLEGHEIPDQLIMPEPADYKKTDIEEFKSFNISDDYIIDVVADFEDGLWALRIIENDLGALGNEKPVGGRTIHSDIAFRIVENKLECGFKTSVSDSEDVEKADCIRFSIIKELCFNSAFGLKQINKLYGLDRMDLNSNDELEEVNRIYKSSNNQLPFVIYTYDDYSDKENSILSKIDLKAVQEESIRKNVFSKAEPYANRYVGIARPYFLPKRMFRRFTELFDYDLFDCNDVLIMEPKKYGGKISSFRYANKEVYRDLIANYSREKEVDFHDVLFIDEARILAERKNSDYVSDILSKLDETNRNLEEVRNKINKIDRVNDYSRNKNADKNNKQLEDALADLQKYQNINFTLDKEINRLKNELQRKNDYIAYLQRKIDRPSKHAEIYNWAKSFQYLLFDKQAIDCLERKDAENVDIDVICDSLDYLGNLYAAYLFDGLSEEELNDQSANIYGRPYEVSPSGITNADKGYCKIRYDLGNGRRELPLDWHLKVGNHGELIRIYFIIDKNKKKIVIGSLPNHLDY